MGLLAQFLLSLTNLVRSGAIRKIPQAIKFAEQQFGKVSPLLKKQIEKVFDSVKKPVVGKTGKIWNSKKLTYAGPLTHANGKVDKVDGFGLSENNLTDALVADPEKKNQD